jgi:aryl-alcohol dehydrogenase-like predicted oxidoreductase
MRALDDAVRAGKIRYIGISDAPAWVVAQANTLADWRACTPFAGLQVPYSLLNRDIERELLPMAEAFGLSVAAWAPLAHGALASRPEATGHGAGPGEPEPPVVAVVREVADELGVSPAQVALAWTRARSRAVHPLVGPRTVTQLEDDLLALGLTLPAEAVDRLEMGTGFELGFPSDFIAAAAEVFSDAAERVDGR